MGGFFMLKRIYYLLNDKKISTLAGSLTFFLVLNGGSFLFLYIVLSNYLPHSFLDLFLKELKESDFKDFVKYFFSYQDNLSYSLFLIGSSIFSSSSLYYHLIQISTILGCGKLNVSVSKRLLAIVLTLLFLIILHVITIFSTYVMLIFKNISNYILWFTLFIIFSVVIIVINLTALHTIKISNVYKGAIFSIIYFIIFTFGFIIYVSTFSNFKVVYGFFSFFVILMFYLYVLAIGLIIGIDINCQKLDVFKFLFSK